MPDRARPFDWSSLEIPLRRFADATGLVVSAYDAEGQRTLGPFASSRLGTLLTESQLLEPGTPGQTFERDVARNATRTDDAHGLFDEQLRVHGLALRYAGATIGGVTFGWVFADYATNHGSERLARTAGVSGRRLWSVARLASPCGDRRIEMYGRLLATLVDSGMGLREAVDELERLAKARESFLALVSHDLRTPLSSISMRLDLLLGGAFDDPAQLRSSLESMRRNVRQQARLIDDLLHVAITRTGRFELSPQPIDLRDVLYAAHTAMAPLAQSRGIELRLESRAGPSSDSRSPVLDSMPMHGDAARLEQVLWNVLSNAVKFTPAGGLIEVTAHRGGSHHVVAIRDTGPGIPEAIREQVFDAFVRTKEDNARGLGLGLSIAQQIVHLHGGRIGVDVGEGHVGTTFTIELPTS